MIITTWNYNGSSRERLAFLERFGADVSMILDVNKPEIDREKEVWIGGHPIEELEAMCSLVPGFH